MVGPRFERIPVTEYDLICLDLNLPDMDGLDVCREITERRAVETGHLTRVLMLTARGGVEDRIAGLDEGADDYMVKPFALGELLARMRALLRRESGATGAVIEWQGLTLDGARQEVHHGTVRVDLNPKEYALLRWFLLHPNEVHSAERLLEHVSAPGPGHRRRDLAGGLRQEGHLEALRPRPERVLASSDGQGPQGRGEGDAEDVQAGRRRPGHPVRLLRPVRADAGAAQGPRGHTRPEVSLLVPLRHAAAGAASRTLLGTLMPDRARRVPRHRGTDRLLADLHGGHFPGDIRAGALLGDLIGDYFLVTRNGLTLAKLG